MRACCRTAWRKVSERLEETRETVRALCESVSLPRNTIDYIRYFCAEDTTDKDAVKANERKRVILYKAVASFVRAYANLANEMTEAGYTPEETEEHPQRSGPLRESPPGGEGRPAATTLT